MAIAALPITDEFKLAWRHDPALDQKKKNFAKAYEVAVETLDWDRLVIPGEQPTWFHFRLVEADTLRRLVDAGLGLLTTQALVFRLGLVRVENFPGCPEVRRERDPEYARFGEMAQMDVVTLLDRSAVAHGKSSIVMELGGHVLNRSSGVSPKS